MIVLSGPGVHNLRVSIEPDTKDWTWVVDQPCPDCGWDPRSVPREQLADEIHANTRGWYDVLADADFAVRPAQHVWSPIEYACHVRDVFQRFDARMELMLTLDDPMFENWDQDATAVEDRYDEQDPATVLADLQAAADQIAARLDGIAGGQWERPGRRSNGSVFTLDTLSRYLAHDPIHHVWDVRTGGAAA